MNHYLMYHHINFLNLKNETHTHTQKINISETKLKANLSKNSVENKRSTFLDKETWQLGKV